MNPFKLISNFIFHNNDKWLTIQALFFSAQMRALLRFVPIARLHPYLGEQGEESPSEPLCHADLRTASHISIRVNRVANRTPWESKCFVRALVAQKLLRKYGLSSTLYLGVGKDENQQMVAHAWIRSGPHCITGEDERDYAVVARFAKYPKHHPAAK